MTYVGIAVSTEAGDILFSIRRHPTRGADRRERLPDQRILSFKDPQELTRLWVLKRTRSPFNAEY